MSAVTLDVLFGLDTFGDVPQDDQGRPVSYARAIRQVVDEAVLADSIGVDALALGEHHRPEYAVSTPETVLAGIATRTERIRLASGVTVLSSDDPVRVHQRFSTLDALSNGRAEVILGRGSFTESFPLFGYDLADYDVLFEEKLNLFVQLLEEKPVTWEGSQRPALRNADVFPKTESGRLPTWVGVGGSPQSVIRTARYGLPLMLAIIGGDPSRFTRYTDLYRRAAEQFGTTAHPVGMHSRGSSPTPTKRPAPCTGRTTRSSVTRSGPCAAGRRSPGASTRPRSNTARCTSAPRTVARKMAAAIKQLGVGRFDLVYTSGAQPVSARLRAVELYGTEVIPMVRELLAD